MQTIQNSAQGLGLLVDMNWDRFFFVGAIGLALVAGSNLGYLMLPTGF
ncbi:MAG: hypothetical protein AAF714_04355 [Pseudomonadota bacterium]